MNKKEIKTVEVMAKDFYGDHCLVDSVSSNNSLERKPQGLVEIYDIKNNGIKKELIRKSNLIVYQGRETLAQMLVKVNTVDEDGNPPLSPVAGNKNMWLNWFGLGQGASDTKCAPGSGDVFSPEPPANENTELKCPIAINTDASSADYHIIEDPGYPGVGCNFPPPVIPLGTYPQTGNYKHPLDSISFEKDILNDNKWMIIKISVVIGANDANGRSGQISGQPINEAGLYTSESDIGGYVGPFSMFARVTFPTLLKDSTRRLQFVWYLFL